MVTRDDLCWSTGPRDDHGQPYCLHLLGHSGPHEPHPEWPGGYTTWGGALCRANPETIRAAWLPLGFLDRLNAGVPYPALTPTVEPEAPDPLPKFEFDRVVDYEKVAEAADWMVLPEYFREALTNFVEQLVAGGFAIVKRVPTDYVDAATRRAETGPPAKVETKASPLVLEDLRRMVIDTVGWSPVTRVDLERRYTETQPKVGETQLVVRRGRLAAHRKRDLGMNAIR